MSLDAQIKYAVQLATTAWKNNEDLRKLFGSAKADKNYPLPVTGDDVAALLIKIQAKRQIIHTTFPKNDRCLAHAVIGSNDYYANLLNKQYAIRETILVSPLFFQNAVRQSVSFTNAGADAGKIADSGIFRAVILLHEARHLYSLTGHSVDPSSHDGLWNDYILWTGFLGQKVAW